MNNLHVDNESAQESFSSAFHASQEANSRAPFQMPVSISRQRRSRNDRALPRLGFWELVDRRHAADIQRKQALTSELYGTPESPEDEYIARIDGDGVEVEGDNNNTERIYLVDGLTQQEQELVLRFAEDPEPLHVMQKRTVRIKAGNASYKTISRIERRLYARNPSYYYSNYGELARHAKQVAELHVPQAKTVTVYAEWHAVPELVDDEEQQEARQVSREFNRRCDERMKRFSSSGYGRSGYRNGGRMRHFLSDAEHRSTIRNDAWTHQFVSNRYELREHLEDLWNEAELAHCDCKEEFEEQQGAEAEAELEAWEEEIRLAQQAVAAEYEPEVRGEREWQNEKRREFLREYRYTSPRVDATMRKALRDYDMELMIYWDLEAEMERSFQESADMYLNNVQDELDHYALEKLTSPHAFAAP
jgi:hypothetical protein